MSTRKTPAAPTLADVRKWPATVSVAQAAQALGVSKDHLYALIRQDAAPVRVLALGTTKRVITADLVGLLSGGREAA
jgi:hypothetical protein